MCCVVLIETPCAVFCDQNMKPAFDLEYFLFERRNHDNGNTHNTVAQSVLARVQLEELKFTADTLMLKAREFQASASFFIKFCVLLVDDAFVCLSCLMAERILDGNDEVGSLSGPFEQDWNGG